MKPELQSLREGDLSSAGRQRLLSARGEPLFLADWNRAVFLHYEVDPAALQAAVPYCLDLWEDRAYVSLVAFTLRRMRPRIGGRLGAWLFRPIATHEFLNVRAYVRHRNEPGIYFLAEWLSNPLSVRLGPPAFGLPYRLGGIDYQHTHEHGELRGSVEAAAGTGALRYRAKVRPDCSFVPCPAGTLDEFLLERYTAFTCRGSRRGFFRIWHPPWPQTGIELTVTDQSLLNENWPCFREARLIGGNYSPGVRDVWMGRSHGIGRPTSLGGTGTLSSFLEFP